MYSDWQNNNRDNSNRQDYNNYNRNNYEGQYDNYNDDFGDRNNREVYEYRERRENRDMRSPRERTSFSPDPSPRDDRQLGSSFNQFNDKVRNLFRGRDKSFPKQNEFPEYDGFDGIENSQPLDNNFVIYAPKSYTDMKKLIDFLREGQPLIVDLGKIRPERGQRILDFLSGAVYALKGTSHKITSSIYLITPKGVNIMVPDELMEHIKKDNG